MINKVLIANRGEIAVRIIRACREMGIETVAVYSKADETALHVQLADEAVCIGPAASRDSYLNMENIISATVICGADAIHPGFGFLSENARFAEMCRQCHITFIGPSPELIHKMGNKSEARKTMMEAGVPVVPGTKEPVYTTEEAKSIADNMGYPVMIKASSGGGGKGMRISHSSGDFEENFRMAQMESISSFSDDTMYIEKYIKGIAPFKEGIRRCWRNHRLRPSMMSSGKRWDARPFRPPKPSATRVQERLNFYWISIETTILWK